MFNWNDIRILLEVARTGSLSQAAKNLAVDGSTVGRRVQALAEELNVPLFERVRGRLSPTLDGERVLEHARRMEKAALDLRRATRPRNADISGRVRVATTRTMAREVMYPVARDIAAAHPELVVEIDENVQRIDMMSGQAEIALTCYPDDHSRLVRRKVFTATGGLYASQAYLEKTPPPCSRSLAGHSLLAVAERNLRTGVDQWFERHAEGGNVVLRSTSAEELTRLCAEGMGIALLFNFRASKVPGLVHLPGFPDFELPHYLVTHPDAVHLPRVRVTKEAILERVELLRPEIERPGSDVPVAVDGVAS